MTNPAAVKAALAMAGHTTWASHTREQVDAALSILAARVRELEGRTCETCRKPRRVEQRESGWWYCDTVSAIVRGERSVIDGCNAWEGK